MRALIVLVGLVATPFLAGVSQQVKTNSGVGHDDAHCGMRYSLHPSATDINKCPPPTPTGGGGGTGGTTGGDTGGTTGGTTGGDTGGTTGCVNSQMTSGTSKIRGQVFEDQAPYSLLGGWCVELKDALSGAVLASMSTSATPLNIDGDNYVFTGVPVGNYVVCEVTQTGWHQSFPLDGPACSPNAGFPVPIAADGSDAPYIWFGNLTP